MTSLDSGAWVGLPFSGFNSNWGFSIGLGSRVFRFLEGEAWGFFLAAAARAPDMRASKAEGREDMARRLGFFGEREMRVREREEGLERKREMEVLRWWRERGRRQ